MQSLVFLAPLVKVGRGSNWDNGTFLLNLDFYLIVW